MAKKANKVTVKMGRPSNLTPEKATILCELISTTHRGLRSICKELNVSTKSVLKLLESSEDFRIQYMCAREMQANVLAEQILTIADTVRIGKKTKTSEKGMEVTTGDMVERARLMIDARKWLAGKLNPKKYGDKIGLEHSGDIGIPQLVSQVIKMDGLPSEEEQKKLHEGE